MKKLKLLIGSLFFCLVSVMLVACNDTPPDRTITSVTANNLQQFYYVEQQIDFSAVTLTIHYSDNTTQQLTKGEVDIQQSDAQEGTEFILHTNGLSAQQTLQEDTYNITCTIIGEEEPRSLITITVDSNMSHVYDLVSFGLPDFVKTYNQNLDNMIGTEDGFTLEDRQYVVGDDNAFIFKPEFAVLPIDDTLPEAENIKVDVTLTEGSTVVGSDVYTFDNATYGLTFKPAAVGHTYKLSMKPTDWTKTDDGSNILPAEFTFTVKDGWNAYTAEDLGRMSITDPAMVSKAYSEGTAFKRLNSGDHGSNFFKQDGTNGYEAANFYEIWNKYYADKLGQDALKPINGLFLHGNISVTEKDLPERYLLSQAEVAAQGGAQSAVGTARDYSYIYTKYLDDDQSFELNGNYFKVDFTDFALSQSHLDSTTKSLRIYKDPEPNYEFGYSIAFVFSGKGKAVNEEMVSANVDMKNIQLVGNAGKALTGDDVEKSSGSLMMVYSAGAVKVHCDNSIVQEALNAFNIEVGWENLNLSNSKVFNCFTAGIYNWGSEGNIITNSVMKNFGGAVIITTSTAEKREGNPTGNPGSKSSVSIDDKSVTECWISGAEAWYQMTGGKSAGLNASTVATTLTQSEPWWNEHVKKSIMKDNKVNVIMIALDTDQLGAPHDYLFSTLSWTKDGDTDPARSVGLDTAVLKTACDTVLALPQAGGQRPVVLQDCNGTTVATNLSSLEPFQVFLGAQGAISQQGQFTGDRCYLRLPVPGLQAAIAAVIGMEDLPPQAN